MSDSPIEAWLTKKSIRNHLPLRVQFDLTYRCNEQCVHCYLDHHQRRELATADVRRILDQLRTAGTLYLTLSGGEIFLRSDLQEILEYARHLHFDVTIKTNGILLDAVRAAGLRRLGVRLVQISIYSAIAEVHDRITQLPGSLGRSLKAIRILKEHGITVKIGCPLMTINVADSQGVAELAANLGVTYVFDPTISPSLDPNRNTVALRAAPEAVLSRLSTPERLASRTPESITPNPSFNDQLPAQLQMDFDRDLPCGAGHNSCYVSPVGEVYACAQFPLSLGNLRQQSFSEIWEHSPILATITAARKSSTSICSECTLRQYCERCPGLAYMEQGKLNGPSERACELAEARARLHGWSEPVSEYHTVVTAKNS